MKNNKELLLSNSFIKARYEITEQELKLLYAMFHKAQNRILDNGKQIHKYKTTDVDFTIKFTSQEIAYWLGIKKNDYHYISTIGSRLLSRTLEIKDKEKKLYIGTHFIETVKYENGILSITPNRYLMQHFMFLKEHFTKIPVITMLKLKNVYAIKIYSLLLEYKNIRNHIELDINELRKFLHIEKKYTDTRNFTRFVLDKVKTELNNVINDFKFDYKFVREGKFYKKIIFYYNVEQLTAIDNGLEKQASALAKFQDVCNYGEKCNDNYKQFNIDCWICKNSFFKTDVNVG